MVVFFDTWAWIALMYSRDPYHEIATSEFRRVHKSPATYVTTDYVLTETITALFNVMSFAEAQQYMEGVFRSFEIPSKFRLERISPHRFEAAWKLRCRYADKPDISFVDLTTMAVMQELGITHIFTGDSHFRKVNLGFQLIPDVQS